MTSAIARLAGVSSRLNAETVAYYLEWALLLAWVPVTLYLLLFAPMPAVHDSVHAFRHAFANIVCH